MSTTPGLLLEIGKSQLNKAGEELCGDAVEVATTRDSTIIILSDGLGSGVKANILASLTTKIAATMLKKGCTIDEVIATLASTLPVCKTRQLAYSTFSILQVFRDGRAYLAEYDNPAVFIGGGHVRPSIPAKERRVGERTIRETYFRLAEGDWLCLVSDGVLHAGIGGIWNLGWGWERVDSFVRQVAQRDLPAAEFAAEIIGTCKQLYGGQPGDDATVVTVKVHQPRRVTLLVGPPQDPADDRRVVEKLCRAGGQKVVCGGTTGNMVARVLGRRIEVDLTSTTAEVPPIGRMEGIDLVTEGMITLMEAMQHLEKGTPLPRLHFRTDGASRLAALLMQSDLVHFIVGKAVNPAHQSPGIPPQFALRPQIITDIARHLRRLGKKVTIEYH